MSFKFRFFFFFFLEYLFGFYSSFYVNFSLFALNVFFISFFFFLPERKRKVDCEANVIAVSRFSSFNFSKYWVSDGLLIWFITVFRRAIESGLSVLLMIKDELLIGRFEYFYGTIVKWTDVNHCFCLNDVECFLEWWVSSVTWCIFNIFCPNCPRLCYFLKLLKIIKTQ